MDDTKINSQHHKRPAVGNPRQQSGRSKLQTPNKVLFNEKPFYGNVAVSRGETGDGRWRVGKSYVGSSSIGNFLTYISLSNFYFAKCIKRVDHALPQPAFPVSRPASRRRPAPRH